MIKQNIRYDVIAQPSPEYLAGKPGRNGIYTVVKLVDDLPPEIIKVFDGHPSSQSREDAYAHARELNQRRRQEIETVALIPFIEDLKALSIADAAEVDRLRTENEMLKAIRATSIKVIEVSDHISWLAGFIKGREPHCDTFWRSDFPDGISQPVESLPFNQAGFRDDAHLWHEIISMINDALSEGFLAVRLVTAETDPEQEA